MVLLDTLHVVSGSKKNKVSTERYYYTSNQIFEQSLDIYRPSSPPSPSSPPPPVVTLVVGSAWLGHRAVIYLGCSWWNSSGPKTIAKLGCTCVCIRHRGAFPKTFSPLSILFVSIMVGILMTVLNWFIGTDGWTVLEEIITTQHVGVEAADVPLGQSSAFILAFFLGLLAMELAGNGSASFDQMQNDVMDALAYVEKNKKRLGLNISSELPIIFGGYSSGGHVASCCAQEPDLWKQRNLPSPENYCESLLYISPVLSTKPYVEMCRKISSMSSSSLSTMSPSPSMPSLSPSDGSQSNDQNAAARRALENSSSSMSSTASLSSLQSTSSPPTWLTSELVKAIFGHAASQTPSPIHTYHKSPSLPSTFVGCRKEMFGLKWLDLFFCSPTYSELLKNIGIDSRYVAVESDHWNILNSTVLSDALDEEIRLVQMRRHRKKSSKKK